MPGLGRVTPVMERKVGTVLIGEAEGEGGEAWWETSFNPSTFRVDGVNKLAMSYLTRQLETFRAEGQAEEFAGGHVLKRRRLSHTDITQELRSPYKDGDSFEMWTYSRHT
jgi:cation diffusion facilitator CzcD-associated flavoprotein CzcO